MPPRLLLRIPTPHSPDRLVRQNVEAILDALCCERENMQSDDYEQVFEAHVAIVSLYLLGKLFLQQEHNTELMERLRRCSQCALEANERWVGCRPTNLPPCAKRTAPAQ